MPDVLLILPGDVLGEQELEQGDEGHDQQEHHHAREPGCLLHDLPATVRIGLEASNQLEAVTVPDPEVHRDDGGGPDHTFGQFDTRRETRTLSLDPDGFGIEAIVVQQAAQTGYIGRVPHGAEYTRVGPATEADPGLLFALALAHAQNGRRVN